MKDPILLNKLYKEVERDNVSVMSDGDLLIFKYTQDCHIEGRWNEINRQARGLIMRTDGTVVARPFAKFFNLGEVSETRLDNLPWEESLEVYEKVDGSCGIGYWQEGIGWKLATPGSMMSEQAIQGTKILNDDPAGLMGLPLDCTPIFEIIYPTNRIVVDYKGETFLSLLAIFELNGVEWHPRRVDQIAEKCRFRRPRRYSLDLRASEIPFEDNSEGYVARFESGLRVKIKNPAYLRVHRLLNYLSPKGVIELIRGREYRATLDQLPPSIARDFDDIRAAVQQKYDLYFNRAQTLHHNVCKETDTWVAFESDRTINRKKQALWIMTNVEPDLRGLVFALLDQKDIEEGLWRLVINEVEISQKNQA